LAQTKIIGNASAQMMKIFGRSRRFIVLLTLKLAKI